MLSDLKLSGNDDLQINSKILVEMEFVYGVLIAFVGIGMVILLRLLTTLFHELGHAIPALLFTKKSVEVYIGSYGNIEDTTYFKVGRFEMYFKWNLLKWQIGMCRHLGQIKSTWKHILVILGGPIASLLISIPLILNLRNIQANNILLFLSVVFIACAVIDLIVNLIPSSTAMSMHDGGTAYSDGYQLLSIVNRSKMPKTFFELENKFQKEQYKEVIGLAELHLEKEKKERFVYDFLIQSLIKTDENAKALSYYTLLKQHIKLETPDYFEIGKLYNKLGQHEEALKFLNHSFHYNFQDPGITNEMGKAHMELGNIQEAIKIFTETISKAPQYPLAYSNRARAFIHIDELDFAKDDLHIAKILDDKDPIMYFYYGLYFERRNDFEKAVEYYKEAKSLGCKQHGLDYKIETLNN